MLRPLQAVLHVVIASGLLYNGGSLVHYVEDGSEYSFVPLSQTVVLVVDDDPTVMRLVQVLMEKHAHQVLLADSGEAALDLASKYTGDIDLLISDVKMPGLNGVQVARKLIQERPGIRVLLMSGHVPEAVGLGGLWVPFLAKPFTPKAFYAAIRTALDGPPPALAESGTPATR